MTDPVTKPKIEPSPIVRVLNRDVGRYHRWCTPSILEQQERVDDFYASDVSISAGFFGTLVDHTGIFGEALRQGAGERVAAITYSVSMTLNALTWAAIWLYGSSGRRLRCSQTSTPWA